jgi:hypothetical protein
MVEHATTHGRSKRVLKQICGDRRTLDLKAAQRLAELEKQYGDGSSISLEQAKARTRLAEASLLQ